MREQLSLDLGQVDTPTPRSLRAGDRVVHRRRTGVVLFFVEPEPGWRRALVRFEDAGEVYEQFVDVEQLGVLT